MDFILVLILFIFIFSITAATVILVQTAKAAQDKGSLGLDSRVQTVSATRRLNQKGPSILEVNLSSPRRTIDSGRIGSRVYQQSGDYVCVKPPTADTSGSPAVEPVAPSTSSATTSSGSRRTGRSSTIENVSKQYVRKVRYTSWFESASADILDHPPDLSDHPELTSGDIFCHCTATKTQLWIWVSGEAAHSSFWEPIDIGYEREDGRRLTLTDLRKPSWVGRNWYAKREARSA
ncbi:hypothetical protein NM688_g7644 [Phlebia brevispora]|uniref:Uncharacterized protein n=1 Tax=Phlebia brevispora TaxID=194682 RepID=A0ACC1S307_9APHY|nr:hypothetical protein NM688_g7644 [Phlebia brevispora]